MADNGVVRLPRHLACVGLRERQAEHLSAGHEGDRGAEEAEAAELRRKLHATILRCLGELKHPDTLEPIVLGFADGSFNGEAAAECLIRFGPAAEPLILKHCRPGNMEHSKTVVFILSKIGTSQSLPALQALSRGHDGFVLRDEIARAAQAIQSRKKAGGKK